MKDTFIIISGSSKTSSAFDEGSNGSSRDGNSIDSTAKRCSRDSIEETMMEARRPRGVMEWPEGSDMILSREELKYEVEEWGSRREVVAIIELKAIGTVYIPSSESEKLHEL